MFLTGKSVSLVLLWMSPLLSLVVLLLSVQKGALQTIMLLLLKVFYFKIKLIDNAVLIVM